MFLICTQEVKEKEAVVFQIHIFNTINVIVWCRNQKKNGF